MTYGSLFTGIGGLDLGLDRAGFECRWQVEIDPYAVRVLEKHWPGVKRYGDITKLTGNELEHVDLMCGGFPCQDLSQAGKQAGITGSRSGLWFEFARIIGVVRPRYVLIENVPGLLIPSAMRRVVGELARLGYVGIWRSLRASEFGASHLRKRVFIVAYRSGERRQQDAGRPLGNEEAHGRAGRDIREPDGDYFPCSNGAMLAYSPAARQARPQDAGTDRGDAREDGSGRIQPERNGFHLGHSQRTRWTQAGTGRHVYAGPEPEEGMRELGVPCSESRQNRHAQPSRPGLEQGLRELPVFAPGPSDPRWPAILRERPDLAPALESPIRELADGISGDLDGTGMSEIEKAMTNRTKRLGRLGNAVVPQIAEWIGRRILEFHKRSP